VTDSGVEAVERSARDPLSVSSSSSSDSQCHKSLFFYDGFCVDHSDQSAEFGNLTAEMLQGFFISKEVPILRSNDRSKVTGAP
jgi:hypothetical protein